MSREPMSQELSAVWEDPSPRSDKEMAERVQILTASGAGYDDRDVEDLVRTDMVSALEQ